MSPLRLLPPAIAALALLTPVLALANPVMSPVTLDLEEEYRLQLRVIGEQIDKQRAIYRSYSDDDIYEEQALIHGSDKTPVTVVLRRTEALLNHLEPQGVPVNDLREQLKELEAKAAGQPAAEMTYIEPKKGEHMAYRLGTVKNEAELFPLFAQAKALQRAASYRNPLVGGLDRIAFVTRFPTAMGHMCDEWYGRVTEPGGGLYILNDPFGRRPTVTDLVSETPVEQGAMAGRILEPGAFVTPEVDYDGQSIYFAYSANDTSFWEQRFAPGADYDKWEHYFHSPDTAYHIFRINADGTGLTQLTEGTWNDFDPAVLPNGRIVFLSERRGGEGRCHPRPCPSYVMHSMLPDGSDIVPISYHEINEWSPTVTNDGRIIYSRWDYVDRSFSKGQYPWISNPDGRNVRALYGNYEGGGGSVHADLRPVPDSPLYFGTEYGHHTASWGTLIVNDESLIDDGTQNTWKFLTPEINRYNRGSHRGAFATPFPLDESFFLAAYSPDATLFSLNGRAPYEKPPTPHGLYLVDKFGNKTLLYRDAEVPVNGPFPLRARKRPPVIPDGTPIVPAPGRTKPAEIPDVARVVLVDVYNSLLPFPEETKIEALRIVQVLPKSTPGNGNPGIAYDREYVARQVLGTVPVEEDGSAHFTMPAKVPVFFQALDGNGMAVQSMRTSAYAMPAETMSCVGCHEPKDRTPQSGGNETLLALQRRASDIQPGPEGSLPFSFARLVQPVLDRHCVECHASDPKLPSMAADGKVHPRTKELQKERRARYANGQWSTAYQNLGPYAFYYNTRRRDMGWGVDDFGDGFRSIPGKNGAMVAPLMEVLTTGVHKEELNMSREDWERLITWLDIGSPFFGAYTQTREQKAGDVVWPELE